MENDPKDLFREMFSDTNGEYELAKNIMIAGCISAESNFTNEDRERNIKTLSDMKEVLEEMTKTKENKEYYNICCDGIETLKREIEENS